MQRRVGGARRNHPWARTILFVLAIATLAGAMVGAQQNGTTLETVKTAAGGWTRTFNWDIDKSVSPESWVMFEGDSITPEWTICVTKLGYQDVYYVSGTITVYNGGAVTTENLTIVDHIQYKVGSGKFQELGAVQILTPEQLAPYTTGVYEYSIPFTPIPGAQYRNVATITITNHSGYLGEPFGPEPKATFALPGAPMLIHDTINVDDGARTWQFADTGCADYSETLTADADVANVATIRETGQSAGAQFVVDVCSLSVAKDASTSYNRYFSWPFYKIASLSTVTLAVGEVYPMGYTIGLGGPLTYTDKDWAVAGNINVVNPAPIAALINSIADVLPGCDDLAVVWDSAVSFPYVLASGETLHGVYAGTLPDGTQRTNTATANLQNYDYDSAGVGVASGETAFSGSADVVFGTPADLINDCVTLTDSFPEGPQGVVVCYDNLSALPITYTHNIGPFYASGTYYIDNVVAVVPEVGNNLELSVLVTVNVPSNGCTLTFGYWKTHSKYGPAPYDVTWGAREDLAFFLSGKTYYQVLMTPPAGNSYYNLAHQYIAAQLNFLHGADSSAAKAAFDAATILFGKYSPASLLKLKGSDPVRAQFVQLAGVLGSYNEGLIGPGHCNE